MNKPNVHVVHEDGEWKVKHAGASRAASVHETKADAQAAGTEMAKREKVELIVHKQDGTIGEKNSFGNDPRSVKG